MKKKRTYILRMLTIMVLAIFSVAITPWSALHHHEEVAQTTPEKNCTHQFHVKVQKESCLLCAAHFEKNYTATTASFTIYLHSKLITKVEAVFGHAFTELISTSLRGPPSLS